MLQAASQLRFGNGCGHDPLYFRSPLLPAFKRRPQVLLDAIALGWDKIIKLTQGAFFARLLHRQRRPDTKYHQVRSERREAYALLLHVLMDYTELSTLRLSKSPDPCGFKPLAFKDLLVKTGLSPSRLSRALGDFHAADYIKTTRRWRYDAHGDAKGEIAIRTIQAKLFYDLGINKEALDAAQKFKRDQQEAIQIKNRTYSKVTKKVLKIIKNNIEERRIGISRVGRGQPPVTAVAMPRDELTRLRLAKYPHLSDMQVLALKMSQFPASQYPAMSILDFLRLPCGASP